ncbi:hypothetical protein ACLOJK_019163 [Asimina triloba]
MTYTSLIKGFCREGMMDSAYDVFNTSLEQDDVLAESTLNTLRMRELPGLTMMLAPVPLAAQVLDRNSLLENGDKAADILPSLDPAFVGALCTGTEDHWYLE